MTQFGTNILTSANWAALQSAIVATATEIRDAGKIDEKQYTTLLEDYGVAGKAGGSGSKGEYTEDQIEETRVGSLIGEGVQRQRDVRLRQ